RPEEQSPQHLLAHAILGAATNYATGNDPMTGAASAISNEAIAPILANYLYGKKPNELSQEQKDTITSILNLTTVTTAYSTTGGSVADAVNGAEIGRVGVENNNEMYLEAEREGAWILADGDRDKYFKLISLQGQVKIVMQSVESVHQTYNDMTIINISGGVAGYTIVINNKNGRVFTSGHPDINVSSLSNILSAGASVNFGSIVGGVKNAGEIDRVIEGPSFATEACKVVCVGRVVTKAGDKINTYGVGINAGYGSRLSGASGIGASGSTMKATELVLTSEQIKKLLGGKK
ncbi:hypothetical protein B0189_06125, partial [Moraxella cuniculi]